MKYEKYLEKLDNLNEEFEEGLLLELHEKPPANLHGEIVRSVNRARKRMNFLNYRVYVPAVAAVLIFAVAINRPEILEKINLVKKAEITHEKTIASDNNSEPGKNLRHEQMDKKTGGENTDSENTPLYQEPPVNSTTTAANDGTEKNNSEEPRAQVQESKESTEKNQEVSKSTITASSNSPTNADTSSGKSNTSEEDNEKSSFNIMELLGLVFYKDTDINYEVLLNENRSVILNYITENNIEKFNTPNTWRLSMEQFEGLDKLLAKYNIGKRALKEAESSTTRIVKIYFVNYNVLINTSAADVVSFIEDQSKCIKMDNSTYKILADDMKELDKKLSAAGIKKELISEAEDKYIIFKASILNYEANIDGSQNAISDFLKNTGKCKLAGDNIYSMSRETLNELKELLSSLGVELKVINETSNNSIMVRIKNN